MFAEVMFFLCMSQVDKFYYEPRLGKPSFVSMRTLMTLLTAARGLRASTASLQCRSGKVQRVDPVPFITGVATILTQVRQGKACAVGCCTCPFVTDVISFCVCSSTPTTWRSS